MQSIEINGCSSGGQLLDSCKTTLPLLQPLISILVGSLVFFYCPFALLSGACARELLVRWKPFNAHTTFLRCTYRAMVTKRNRRQFSIRAFLAATRAAIHERRPWESLPDRKLPTGGRSPPGTLGSLLGIRWQARLSCRSNGRRFSYCKA